MAATATGLQRIVPLIAKLRPVATVGGTQTNPAKLALLAFFGGNGQKRTGHP